MTDQEYTETQAQLVAVDTEAAALSQQERDLIDQARQTNDARRVVAGKRTELLRRADPLRAAVAQHAQELRAKARQEAADKAKAKEESELTKANAEIAALKEQLAAKG